MGLTWAWDDNLLGSDDNNLLPYEKLFGTDRCKSSQQVAFAINDNNISHLSKNYRCVVIDKDFVLFDSSVSHMVDIDVNIA